MPCTAKSIYLQLLLALLLALAASTANAATNDCTQAGSPPVPSTTPLTNLQIPRDLPIGGVIPGSRVNINWTWTCKPTGITGGKRWTIMPDGAWAATAVQGLTNVYQVSSGDATGVSGIGFRFLDASGNSVPFGPVGYANAVDMGDAPQGQTSFHWSGAIELVKTADKVSAGTGSMWLITGVAGQVYGNENQAKTKWTYSYTISKPAVTTCTVTNPTQSVTLPTVSRQALTSRDGKWMYAGDTPFSIDLNCSKGAHLYMVMTDAINPQSRISYLVQRGEWGKWRGIQIKRGDGTLQNFGPDASAAGTENQFLIGDTPDGVLKIPLLARYVVGPMAEPFPPGPIEVSMTFTLSYQ
ncbi:hypothetical protein ISN75_16720 [Dyella marensis]|uniref:fimbrial protein n=1 Tax=Dyella marensis TaxID=500610 RepID=UPI0031D927BD